MNRHLRRVSVFGRPRPADVSLGQGLALLMRLLEVFTPFALAKEGTGQESG
jgi:hypothetical protein